ncbi:hypothetical protein J3R74_000810 [Puniceicoccus vermicola]
MTRLQLERGIRSAPHAPRVCFTLTSAIHLSYAANPTGRNEFRAPIFGLFETAQRYGTLSAWEWSSARTPPLGECWEGRERIPERRKI